MAEPLLDQLDTLVGNCIAEHEFIKSALDVRPSLLLCQPGRPHFYPRLFSPSPLHPVCQLWILLLLLLFWPGRPVASIFAGFAPRHAATHPAVLPAYVLGLTDCCPPKAPSCFLYGLYSLPSPPLHH